MRRFFYYQKEPQIAYDGIQFNNRVDSTTERKLAAKVTDNILNGRTYAARLLGRGKVFSGKTQDYTVKITDSAAGEFFTGLETLNSAASDTTITLSYAHTAFTQPQVSIMLESFSNSGPEGTIDLDAFKADEAVAEAVQRIGTALYGTGSANQPLGLGAIVDDGTDVGTIGGQSRTTYTTLKATRSAASGGTLSLSVLATLNDTVKAAGLENEEPNIHVTTKTVWSLYEQLLAPSVRADYASIGYNQIGLRSSEGGSAGSLKGAAGFSFLSYRGRPVIADDACTSGRWFHLNENYFDWAGRASVPAKYAGKLEKVSLGNMSTLEGTGAEAVPPKANGWFHQPMQMLPNQAGMIGRFYLIGQVCAKGFRRSGVHTGLTGV